MKNTKLLFIFALTAGFTINGQESNDKNLRTRDEEYAIKYEAGKKLQKLVELDEEITSDEISKILDSTPDNMLQDITKEQEIERIIEFASDLRNNKILKNCYFQLMESMKQEIGATHEEISTIRAKSSSCNEMLQAYSELKEANLKQE